jgi:hypothetical protein
MSTTGSRDGYKTGTFRWGQFTVIVAVEADRWHMSISHPRRDLTYDELKKARYHFLPKTANVAMIFPPPEDFLNFHEHCFHFWEITPEMWDPEQIARTKAVNKAARTLRASERSQRRDNSDSFR